MILGFRAIALMSVLAKCSGYCRKKLELIEWKGLRVGSERRVNCEHMQALLTNVLHGCWEWQEDRREA